MEGREVRGGMCPFIPPGDEKVSPFSSGDGKVSPFSDTDSMTSAMNQVLVDEVSTAPSFSVTRKFWLWVTVVLSMFIVIQIL